MTLAQSPDLGDIEHLRQRIGDMFSELERKGREAQILSEEITSARFALTAFIDEAIARSDWHGRQEWGTRPLALEYFQTNNAGDEFFDRLEELRRRPDVKTGLLEVYYTCLTLGFEGKYALADPRELRDLIESIGRDLERVRGRVLDLSPRWQPPETQIQRFRSILPMWVVSVVCLVVLLIAFVALRHSSRSHADTMAEQVEAETR
jgi:type VI secretion system protein ImpK